MRKIVRKIIEWFKDGSKKCDICQKYRINEELKDFEEEKKIIGDNKWKEIHICKDCMECIERLRKGIF